MKQLHVVFLLSRFHPFKGGAEANALELAKRLVETGHQVSVLTSNIGPDNEKLSSHETYAGINIIRSHAWNHQMSLGFYPGLLPNILKIKADVIHYENGPGIFWQEFCLLLKRITSRRTKFINTPHGPFLAANNHQGAKRILGWLMRIITFPYFRILWPLLFDKLIAVNPLQLTWMRRRLGFGSTKVIMIPNGIPAEMLITDKPNVEFAKEIVLTGTGRLALYKGWHHIIEALYYAGQHKLFNKNVRLILIGRPGNASALLQSLIAKYKLTNVEIKINPTDAERDRILAEESHINILPSEWEATGIVLLEAMAKGNAVISSNGNEAADWLIAKRHNGFVYQYGNIKELALAIASLVNDKFLLKRIIATNMGKSKSLTWERIFPDYLSLVESL